jgi:putative flippase GtrA
MSSTPRKEFLLFCVAGVIGLVVDTAVLYATAPLLGWYGGRVVSFLAAATATWLVNRHYAFAMHATAYNEIASILREYGSYLTSMLVGGVVNYLTYALIITWLKTPWSAMLGVAAGSIAGLLFNFASARYVVFKSHR